MSTDLADLRVYLDGQAVGTVTQSRGGSLTFTYDEDYRASDNPTPLSLSMPLARESHKNRAVSAFLEGLLPDSIEARQRLAREYSASANSAFSLLRHVGRDAAGAVQILPVDVEPSDAAVRTGDVEWLSDEELHRALVELAEHGRDWDPGRGGGRWSLAGAQPKIALHQDPETKRWGVPRDSTPTTHIFKPSVEGLARHHVNETLCMLAAREAGLPAARTEILDLDDVHAIVSTRYDRLHDQETHRWRRLHQEDMCQALSYQPTQKYQSDGGPGVGEIADLFVSLNDYDRSRSALLFFDALAYNALIGGTDAHAKNYSLVHRGGRSVLAPLYDIASAACYPTHRRLGAPMKIGSATYFLDVTEKDWRTVAKRLGLDQDAAVERVETLRSALPAAFERAVESLPEGVRAEATQMADRIVAHAQRSWEPDLDRDPGDVLQPSQFWV